MLSTLHLRGGRDGIVIIMFILTLSTLHHTHVDFLFPLSNITPEELTSEMTTQAQQQSVHYLGHGESAETESSDLGRTLDDIVGSGTRELRGCEELNPNGRRHQTSSFFDLLHCDGQLCRRNLARHGRTQTGKRWTIVLRMGANRLGVAYTGKAEPSKSSKTKYSGSEAMYQMQRHGMGSGFMEESPGFQYQRGLPML